MTLVHGPFSVFFRLKVDGYRLEISCYCTQPFSETGDNYLCVRYGTHTVNVDTQKFGHL